MKEKKYLPIGSNIADKYEVIDILGEDEFEILYLVRDIQRQKTFFVLKELFLETFSSREGELVFTIPEALGVFHKRKKQIIEEIKSRKGNSKNSEIKIYGYEDENNTVYTIMEYSNNASLEKYLHFIHKDTEPLPTLDDLLSKEKIFDYALILKILLLSGLILGITFYAYTFFQKDSLEEDSHEFKKTVSENFPKLKERKKEVVEQTVESQKSQVEINEAPLLKVEANITERVTERSETAIKKEEVILKPIVPDIAIEENSIEVLESDNDTVLEEKLPILEENLTEESTLIPIERELQGFLDEYITASATSAEDTMKFYDEKVKKYFRFNHPTHKTIIKSQKRYNKKWVHREFEISDFKLLRSYQKKGVNYYDVQTTTVWKVKNNQGKKASGTSRGAMTLKEVDNGFKIISIYAIK